LCAFSQDYKIAERIEMEGKGCLIVVNKWDTIPNKNQQTSAFYEQDVRQKLRNLHWAPIVYASAISGQSVDKYDCPCYFFSFRNILRSRFFIEKKYDVVSLISIFVQRWEDVTVMCMFKNKTAVANIIAALLTGGVYPRCAN